jgi:hypothetical protein
MANTNENLVYAWTVQALGNTVSQTGYAEPGNAPAAASLSAASQATSGDGYSAAGTGTYGSNESLTNPGYASAPGLVTPGALTAPSLPTSGTGIAVNPSGLSASVMVTCGGAATVTAVSIAPAGSTTFTSIGFTLANSTDGEFTVPPAGQVKITYTGTPTWVWTAVN